MWLSAALPRTRKTPTASPPAVRWCRASSNNAALRASSASAANEVAQLLRHSSQVGAGHLLDVGAAESKRLLVEFSGALVVEDSTGCACRGEEVGNGAPRLVTPGEVGADERRLGVVPRRE